MVIYNSSDRTLARIEGAAEVREVAKKSGTQATHQQTTKEELTDAQQEDVAAEESKGLDRGCPLCLELLFAGAGKLEHCETQSLFE
jgi:hypothetical protein